MKKQKRRYQTPSVEEQKLEKNLVALLKDPKAEKQDVIDAAVQLYAVVGAAFPHLHQGSSGVERRTQDIHIEAVIRKIGAAADGEPESFTYRYEEDEKFRVFFLALRRIARLEAKKELAAKIELADKLKQEHQRGAGKKNKSGGYDDLSVAETDCFEELYKLLKALPPQDQLAFKLATDVPSTLYLDLDYADVSDSAKQLISLAQMFGYSDGELNSLVERAPLVIAQHRAETRKPDHEALMQHKFIAAMVYDSNRVPTVSEKLKKVYDKLKIEWRRPSADGGAIA